MGASIPIPPQVSEVTRSLEDPRILAGRDANFANTMSRFYSQVRPLLVSIRGPYSFLITQCFTPLPSLIRLFFGSVDGRAGSLGRTDRNVQVEVVASLDTVIKFFAALRNFLAENVDKK